MSDNNDPQRMPRWELDVAQAIDRGVAREAVNDPALHDEDARALATDGEEVRWERCLLRPDPILEECSTLPEYVARLVEEAAHVLVEVCTQGQAVDLDLLRAASDLTSHAYHLAALVRHGAWLDWHNPEGDRWMFVPRQPKREREEGHTD